METNSEKINGTNLDEVKKAPVAADESGVLRAKNFEEAWRLANTFLASGILPNRFTKIEMVLTAMQFANELGIPALTGLRQIAVVKGTPTIFGDLPLSLCYASEQVEHLREYTIDDKGNEICSSNKNLTAKPYGAVCIVKRRGDKEPSERFFTLQEAKDAGLYPGKDDSSWRKYPKIMLKYRARTQALKDKFPDKLNGIAIAEYDFNVCPTEDGNIPRTNLTTDSIEIYTATPDQNKQIKEWFVKYEIEQQSQPEVLKDLFGKSMTEAEVIVQNFKK